MGEKKKNNRIRINRNQFRAFAVAKPRIKTDRRKQDSRKNIQQEIYICNILFSNQKYFLTTPFPYFYVRRQLFSLQYSRNENVIIFQVEKYPLLFLAVRLEWVGEEKPIDHAFRSHKIVKKCAAYNLPEFVQCLYQRRIFSLKRCTFFFLLIEL